MSEQNKPCTEVRVSREVIENQLLVSLEDKSKVALLITEVDLDLLIEALKVHDTRKADEMAADLKQLKMTAFPK